LTQNWARSNKKEIQGSQGVTAARIGKRPVGRSMYQSRGDETKRKRQEIARPRGKNVRITYVSKDAHSEP